VRFSIILGVIELLRCFKEVYFFCESWQCDRRSPSQMAEMLSSQTIKRSVLLLTSVYGLIDEHSVLISLSDTFNNFLFDYQKQL
jgi:hypothetical protein